MKKIQRGIYPEDEKVRANLARLFLVANLLYQNKNGLTYEEIAEECEMHVKTAQRDLVILEKAGWPIYKNNGRIFILADRIRPPICLMISEAVTIFMASRLLLSYGNSQNPSIENTLKILSSIVPDRLRDQIFKTVKWMGVQKQDERFVKNMEALAQAWIEGRSVRILYQKLGDNKAVERKINTYFIQPSARDHGNYVIAYCHLAQGIRMFKIERIKSVEPLKDRYIIPAEFDANKYLDSAWGVVASGKVVVVKLKFHSDIAMIARETMWHNSQKNVEQKDGSVLVTFKLALSPDFEGFVLGWGDKVEVLEPASLRQKVIRMAGAIQNLYKK